MLTRRVSMATLVALMGAFLLIGNLGLPASAPAQPTKSGVKEKVKTANQQAHVKWESLTPDQKAHLQTLLKADEQKAQAQWDAMTPEGQQKLVAKARAGGAKAKATWKSLPE
jgi:hypothetical protein